MELKAYVEPRGVSLRLARTLGVTPVLVSQWATGARPVPEDRAPAIEFHTNFQVPVETLCPDTRWHRVWDPAWPHGKPLIDKTPKPGLLQPNVPPAALANPQPESA
jgi:DNA-binding transcriptional regulator YdaS (Cro superfamily)